MCRRSICVIASCLLVLGVASSARAQSASGDLAKVQGKWERTVRDTHGEPTGRAVKDVHGNHETVTYYDLHGQITHRHTAEFQLESSGLVRLFTFSNLVVTDGKDKGRRTPGPVSYVYRVNDKQFAEAWGFLPGQEKHPVQLFTWRRAGNEPEATPAAAHEPKQ